MGDIRLMSWEEILLKVLDETDSEKLAQLVPETELAMFNRKLELSDSPENSEELSTMCVATEALRVVKRRIIKPGVLASPAGSGARFADRSRRTGTG
jgi:hypothetical protein